MKIVALKAENIKKLVAVEIKPDGNVVQITGKNGQGKTSILDSLFWGFAGKAAIQAEPIRQGEKKALIQIDLGEMIVKRTFKKTDEGEVTTSISVESKEGAKFPSPQAMLDQLIGSLSFDPLAFSRMSPREQFDALKKLVPGVDFDALAAANKADFDRRTALNRRAKENRVTAEAYKVAVDGPIERIDEAALVAKLEDAGKHNAAIADRKVRREQFAKDIIAKKAEAQKVREQIEELLKREDALYKEAAAMEQKLADAPELPEPIDTTAIRAEIEKARAENRVRLDRETKNGLIDAADKLEAEASGLTEAMEKREADKRAAIAAAKLPVAGLSFGDGAILMNGVPFNQASDAEQLRASIAIAMSLNPKLRVIRVRDGSLLDENSMKLLAEMANDRDYQVWVERVDGSGKVGFVVEDGHVREAVAA